MSVWFAIPSARPAIEAEARLVRWRVMGYHIAVLRQGTPIAADLSIPTEVYRGWAASTNILAQEILQRDPDAQWIVGGGDDYLPDFSRRAEEIAAECEQHFGGTFGVMQPTGDRWGSEDLAAQKLWPHAPAYIDRVAGSPWMGRDWCLRAYGGNGPMFGAYHHMFADEELQCVATKLKVFWQRRDLVQKHEHWSREYGCAPDFLKPVNTSEHWNSSRTLFQSRRDAEFPGHEPTELALPKAVDSI